jgi:hypothetical protein
MPSTYGNECSEGRSAENTHGEQDDSKKCLHRSWRLTKKPSHRRLATAERQASTVVGSGAVSGHTHLLTVNSNSTINAQNNPDAIHKGIMTTNGGSSCNTDQTAERGHEATAQTIVQQYSKGVGGVVSENTKNTIKNKPTIASVAQTATTMNRLILNGSDVLMWKSNN